MTLFVFPDPRADLRATLAANASRWPAGTTWSEKPATEFGLAPHIQYAWDGTPTGDQQRENAAVRFTIWGWKVETAPGVTVKSEGDLTNLASLVRAVFLDSGSSLVWRYRRGLGLMPGKDPDSGSQITFCTFTLTAETRPSAVA